MTESNQKYRSKKKAMITERLGNICYFCKKETDNRIHNKQGIRHLELADMNLKNLKLALASNEYVILCPRCHGCVHWCMKYLNKKWIDLI